MSIFAAARARLMCRIGKHPCYQVIVYAEDGDSATLLVAVGFPAGEPMRLWICDICARIIDID